MTKEDRNKICITCSNHVNDDRYGILCGLTSNFANFQKSCKDYKSNTQFSPIVSSTTIFKKKEKKGFGSVIGVGVVIWFVFKLILKLVRGASE